MTLNETEILAVAQKIYLTLNGVYNDVTGTEQTEFIDMSIDWINQYLQELEMEADWSWLRVNDNQLGTVTSASTSIQLPDDVQRLAVSNLRDPSITLSNGKVVTFRLVKPNQLRDPNNPSNPNRCAVIGRTIYFSRNFTADEIGAVVKADTIGYLTPVSRDNTDTLSIIDPQQLLVLGAAKNVVLPDVVNNTLTPQYTAKYADLLRLAKDKDGQSAELDSIETDDLSYITGVY